VGSGLLAAVIVKLFFVDLSGQGTIERIVSFVGVGVLILVIGYMAPVPPAANRRVHEVAIDPPLCNRGCDGGDAHIGCRCQLRCFCSACP
jgi:hypothetical protein